MLKNKIIWGKPFLIAVLFLSIVLTLITMLFPAQYYTIGYYIIFNAISMLMIYVIDLKYSTNDKVFLIKEKIGFHLLKSLPLTFVLTVYGILQKVANAYWVVLITVIIGAFGGYLINRIMIYFLVRKGRGWTIRMTGLLILLLSVVFVNLDNYFEKFYGFSIIAN